MNVLCIPEHRKCENYELDENPMVEIICDVEFFEKDTTDILIMYMLSGVISLSYGMIRDYPLIRGDFMLFQPGIKITGKAKSPIKTLFIRINDHVSLCDKYTLEKLYKEEDIMGIEHKHLTSNAIIKTYMDSFAENITNGLRCVRFIAMKSQELFYYLRAYYPKDELASFNLPLLNVDSRFMHFVWKNYRLVHNVEQLALLANCSMTALEAKFRKITGMPAGRWLSEQKAKNLYHDIYCGQKSLKDISNEYRFSSISHMGIFCRKYFGVTPGKIKTGKTDTKKARI